MTVRAKPRPLLLYERTPESKCTANHWNSRETSMRDSLKLCLSFMSEKEKESERERVSYLICLSDCVTQL